jgi:hypothetical protein
MWLFIGIILIEERMNKINLEKYLQKYEKTKSDRWDCFIDWAYKIGKLPVHTNWWRDVTQYLNFDFNQASDFNRYRISLKHALAYLPSKLFKE